MHSGYQLSPSSKQFYVLMLHFYINFVYCALLSNIFYTIYLTYCLLYQICIYGILFLTQLMICIPCMLMYVQHTNTNLPAHSVHSTQYTNLTVYIIPTAHNMLIHSKWLHNLSLYVILSLLLYIPFVICNSELLLFVLVFLLTGDVDPPTIPVNSMFPLHPQCPVLPLPPTSPKCSQTPSEPSQAYWQARYH